jgi:tetratricopeptide (TPR) repeat protein
MRLAVVFAAVALSAFASNGRTYNLSGRLVPEMQAAITLFGATSPFTASTLADSRGRFRFENLQPGAYTIAAFVPGRGEMRRTIDVGSSAADERGRVIITLQLEDQALTPDRSAVVSARELSIPESAWKQYSQAQKKLSKRDIDGAIEHLLRATKIAPQFVSAWNLLGTIAYQTRKYPQSEEYFRRALREDPSAYEPLVNLGGVLLTLDKVDEAYQYNLYSVLKRPNDALANSQLGMTYFALGKLDLAEKYLLQAVRLDPAHFSNPQLLLAEIRLRRGDKAGAARQLEDFLKYHPDWPTAAKIRDAAAKLEQK